MRLPPKEYEQFSQLYNRLLYFCAEKADILAEGITLKDWGWMPWEAKLDTRNHLYENPFMFYQFVEESRPRLSEEEREIIFDFQQSFVKSDFYVVNYGAKHAIFISSKEHVPYGVLALNRPFEEVITEKLPTIIITVLLPWKGKIIFDGMIERFAIVFGSGINSSVRRLYTKATAEHGIITSI